MSAPPRAIEARTLVELLELRAQETGQQMAYDFCGESRTYSELWREVNRFAVALIANGVDSGDRVVMILPNGHDFFAAFYGVQRAGAIAVPIFPFSTPDRILGFAELCQARHLVVPSRTPADTMSHWKSQAPHLTILGADDHTLPDQAATLPMPEPDHVAFIQYTSGSTGDPKGVQLSHANLLTNVQQMIVGMQITTADRFVSWLPTYHDLGLIVMTMTPFYLGAPLYLLPAELSDTRPWLDTIAEHKGTFTAAPDFGYRLALRHLASDAERPVPDLSSLRVALNAAEPVRQTTLDDFHQTFGIRDVMVAAYGLAEATVGVSMWSPSTTNRVDAGGAVSAGPPFPDVKVIVLDDEDQPVPAGTAGHLAVTSPANTRGYFRNPTATAALLIDSNTIRTGDIGYVDEDGYLYILGRAKDTIIQAGLTIYPEDVEEVVNLIPGVRYSVAIGVDHGRMQGEQLTVLAEIRTAELSGGGDLKRCVIGITKSVKERFGLRPARVHLVAAKTISMTHNGKLRRQEMRRRYVEDELGDAILYPPRPTPDTRDASPAGE